MNYSFCFFLTPSSPSSMPLCLKMSLCPWLLSTSKISLALISGSFSPTLLLPLSCTLALPFEINTNYSASRVYLVSGSEVSFSSTHIHFAKLQLEHRSEHFLSRDFLNTLYFGIVEDTHRSPYLDVRGHRGEGKGRQERQKVGTRYQHICK